MYRLPSTSTISAPSPRAMKIGSRPIARMARTGEFTPPGRSAWARLNSSVLSFPALEVVGEIEEADLLELRRGVQRRALLHAGVLGDRVEDRVALLLRAAMGHGEDAVGPVRVGRPLVAVRDAAEGRHALAVLELLALGHLPHAHPVGAEAGAAVEEDRRDAPEQLALLHACEVLEQLGLVDAERVGGRPV